MISKSIERAQRKVEENNFGIRKRLLEYDDVMNSQREVIYKKRRHALLGERLSVDIANMMYDVSENLVDEYHSIGDFENFNFELIRSFSMESPMNEQEFIKVSADEVVQSMNKMVIETYKRKEETIAAQAIPVISIGGSSVISVLANAYPGEWSDMVNYALKNNFQAAREIHYKFVDLISLLFVDGNPTGIKAAQTPGYEQIQYFKKRS
ncbi:Protein translocase subunit SecA [subsurface metagenome]